MNKQPATDVINKSIVVRCNIENAFRLWTEEINLWWPKSHSLSNDPNTVTMIEPRVGGRFYERTSQGDEHEWGTVTVWEPPHHLAYTWYLGSGPTMPTHVDVYFSSEDDGQTRIDITHGGPNLIGELWFRNSTRYDASWESVLNAYLVYARDRS